MGKGPIVCTNAPSGGEKPAEDSYANEAADPLITTRLGCLQWRTAIAIIKPDHQTGLHFSNIFEASAKGIYQFSPLRKTAGIHRLPRAKRKTEKGKWRLSRQLY